MADILREFYQCIEGTLRSIAGQTTDHALNESLYRDHVLDRGWKALPNHLQAMGRQQLRWDDILLLLRREVYSNQKGKLVLRDDASGRIFSALSQMLGGEAVAPPVATPVKVATPVASSPPPAAAAPVKGTLSKPAPRRRPAAAAPARPAAAPVAAAPAKPAAPPAVAVGIDLGTTFSVIAHLDAHGRPVCLPNAAGELLTPTVVLFEEGNVIVGKEAVLAASMEPDKVADSFKRNMGAKSYRKKVAGREFPPEVLSAFVLCSLKADAERKLGPVKKAVITVPAYFDEVRRRATMDAGNLAGLDVLDIINEPTAAAIAYGYQVGFLDRQGAATGDRPIRVLVYDLGGGTFDVTILEIQGTSFRALATDGDVYLGGKDWDEKMMEIVAERFRKQSGKDPRKNPATLQELWLAVEGAKRTLTERSKAPLYLHVGGKRVKVELTRQEFEEATAALLDRTRTTCEIVIRQSGLRWSDIDKVLLVGGSTRMPQVGKMLQELTGKVPDRSVNPDEAVAHGAALYADLVLRKRGGAKPRFSITNINSHSLGIVGIDPSTKQRRNQILIAKNTPLPQSVTRVFRTLQPGQPLVTIRVVEGESERPEACSQVGVLTIRDLPPDLPEGYPVQVSYSYQENGQLQVVAKLQGHPSIVTTYFLRDNSLEENDLKTWAAFVAKKWNPRKE